MFDIGWPELMVVAIVLIVVVGPKDLPRMLRTFGKTSSKLRGMAGDFRRQFDDALKEAELDEVKSVIDSARKMDPTADIRKQLNPLNKIGDEIKSSLNAVTKPTASKIDAVTTPAPEKAENPAIPAQSSVKSEAAKSANSKPAAKPKAATKAKSAAKQTRGTAGSKS